MPETPVMTPEQKKANLRTALILLSVVAVFLGGFVARMVWFR